MTGHFIERCRACRVVTQRCRCPGPHEERLVTCEACGLLGRQVEVPADVEVAEIKDGAVEPED